MAGEIELFQAERVERLEHGEDHVFGLPAIDEVARAVDAGKRDGDDAAMFREPFVKRLQFAHGRVNVGEAVKIDQRIAGAGLDHRDLAAANFDYTVAHFTASGACCSR